MTLIYKELAMQKGFDNQQYVTTQSQKIKERISEAGGRLYLEFGGKLFDDCHAARVLPGFDVNAKVKILGELKDEAEIIIAISAIDLARNKIRADFNIGYGADVLRLMDNLRGLGIYVSSVVITQYDGQSAADIFKTKMERRGESVFIHTRTKGYPTDIDTIISEEGYGNNPYIPTSRPLVVVTAPGPGSGKLATCLCQLYHEHKSGRSAGYAKFETFPIWNLPLKHPVNVAYEAATADLKDVNMIDYFHLEAYGESTVNYNRDIEVFPIARAILRKITGKDIYKSPTDMGVNMAGNCIINDEIVCAAAKQEVIRRYYKICCDYIQGNIESNCAKDKVELLMTDLGITIADRPVATIAIKMSEERNLPVVALQLRDGHIITGKRTKLLSAASSCVFNAIKELANINDAIDLIAPVVIEPILRMKSDIVHEKYNFLTLSEALLALSIGAVTSPIAEIALKKLELLNGCEAHCSCLLNQSDENVLKKLGVNISCEPIFSSSNLYNE